MEPDEPEIVDWPSLLFALLVDSFVVWAPAVLAFMLLPAHRIPIAMGVLLGALLANWALYNRGTTLGARLAGFRLRTRRRQVPGAKYGLILALTSLLSVPAVLLLVIVNVPGGDVSGPLGDPASYPLLGERTGRRRLLEAADAYWERWSY
ncbi:hypothetical protein [Arthrobacter celericrescens]|uniref:hypothetical protein n=1 Tax=Arthrobacter celericrescens TaxID=2320851 RepID=UPI000EA2AEA6|nr:hypothetical protein [Arthrobacter celericrescens]